MQKLRELKFPKQRGTVPLSVVISKTDTGFATHLRDHTFPGNQGKMHGHYFNDLISAEVDFDKRIRQLHSDCYATGAVREQTVEAYRIRHPEASFSAL